MKLGRLHRLPATDALCLVNPYSTEVMAALVTDATSKPWKFSATYLAVEQLMYVVGLCPLERS